MMRFDNRDDKKTNSGYPIKTTFYEIPIELTR